MNCLRDKMIPAKKSRSKMKEKITWYVFFSELGRLPRRFLEIRRPLDLLEFSNVFTVNKIE